MSLPISERKVAVSIILTILTCGIYGIYWFVMLTNEIRNASKDDTMPTGGMAVLLTIVTCGLYEIYWAYRMGKGLTEAHRHHGSKAPSDNAVLFVVLQILGLGIVNYAIMQSDLNSLVRARHSSKKK